MDDHYPRDMVGYGARTPDPKWPGSARIALQFVINYEEGAENSILHGDETSEVLLAELGDVEPVVGMRNVEAESLFEYGSRVGVWRLLRLFGERDLPVTVYAVGMALERNPEVGAAFVEAGHEIATHGYRWIDYQHMGEDEEREHVRLAIAAQERVTGSRPLGWYTGRASPNTRRLVVEEGGFLYDADSYADELPYWDTAHGRPHLVIPYTFDCNDQNFALNAGFTSGDQFFGYLKDAFDLLYAEGAEAPKMMSVGLHCRLVGRPGRAAALARFLDYVGEHDKVWVCRRVDIAHHWHREHPYR